MAVDDDAISQHIRDRYARVVDVVYDHIESALRPTTKLSEREMVLKVVVPHVMRDAQTQRGSSTDAERSAATLRFLRGVDPDEVDDVGDDEVDDPPIGA